MGNAHNTSQSRCAKIQDIVAEVHNAEENPECALACGASCSSEKAARSVTQTIPLLAASSSLRHAANAKKPCGLTRSRSGWLVPGRAAVD